MDWEQALRQRAMADPVVSGLAATRISWSQREAGEALPALVLKVVSDPRPQNLKAFTGRRESRVQVDCWAKKRTDAVALREAAIAALVPAGTFDGVKFGRGSVEPIRDMGEQTESGFVHRDSFDLLIWHD